MGVEVGQGQPLEATLTKLADMSLGFVHVVRADQRLLSSRRVSQSRNRTPTPPSSPGSTALDKLAQLHAHFNTPYEF